MTPQDQTELHLPAVPADEVLRAKIKELETQVIAAESRGDDAECQRLLRERTRLQRIIRASLDRQIRPAQ